jgi:DNA repair exonuclease SbcCD nuclease subunit
MKIVVLSDLHFISQNDPRKKMIENRKFLRDGWGSFRMLAGKIRDEAPDLVVSTGDLVDWYSNENRDFALEMLSEMRTPWVATPGNHDYSTYTWDEAQGKDIPVKGGSFEPTADPLWKAAGVDFSNRVIDADGAKLILVHSAFSGVAAGTGDWMNSVTAGCDFGGSGGDIPILFTHVPINTKPVWDYILGEEPDRDMDKYIMSKSPELFDQSIRGKIPQVYTGHLHFPGEVEAFGTHMHMQGLSVVMVGRSKPGMGKAAVFDTRRVGEVRTLSIG